MKRTLVVLVCNGTRRLAVLAVAASTLLAGCGGSAPLFTSDGRPTILVQCSAQGPASACTENARGMCEGEFDVINESTDNRVRNLLFACKPK